MIALLLLIGPRGLSVGYERESDKGDGEELGAAGRLTPHRWSLESYNLPLLSFPDALKGDLALSLVYPGRAIGLPLLQRLEHDTQLDNYTAIYVRSEGGPFEVAVLGRTQGESGYRTQRGFGIQLLENGPREKVLVADDGTTCVFAPAGHTDWWWRVKSISLNGNQLLNLNYSDEGMLATIVDAHNRTVSFGYQKDGRIRSVTQTWRSYGQNETRSWGLREAAVPNVSGKCKMIGSDSEPRVQR